MSPERAKSVVKNLLAVVPGELSEEVAETLAENKHIRIERIVSRGQASPAGCWYDQDQNEWVVVLRGAARLQFEDCSVDMKAGDYVDIPAHTKHRVAWTTPDEPTIWLAVHYGTAGS